MNHDLQIRQKIFNFRKFHFHGEAAERFALAAGGRGRGGSGSRKKPEARKMPENAAESHQSAARFVGQPCANQNAD